MLDLAPGWDDPEEVLPLPFDMVVWGDTCTLMATANLGEMILGAGNNTHLIAPLFADICDVAPADTTGQDVSEIRYTYEGVAPNRVFKVEYHNVVAEGFQQRRPVDGNFDPYTYGGTLLVAEGPADSTRISVVEDIYGWLYSGAQGWGNTWPSEGTGYVFNPVLPTDRPSLSSRS